VVEGPAVGCSDNEEDCERSAETQGESCRCGPETKLQSRGLLVVIESRPLSSGPTLDWIGVKCVVVMAYQYCGVESGSRNEGSPTNLRPVPQFRKPEIRLFSTIIASRTRKSLDAFMAYQREIPCLVPASRPSRTMNHEGIKFYRLGGRSFSRQKPLPTRKKSALLGGTPMAEFPCRHRIMTWPPWFKARGG